VHDKQFHYLVFIDTFNDRTEILLKVVLNTINQPTKPFN